MDVSEILEEIQDRVDDTSVTAPEVIKWINRCQDILAAELGPEINSEAIINEVYKEYKWDTDFLNVKKVELLDANGTFKRILENVNYRGLQDDTGDPYYYYLRGRVTGVYPFPDSATTGKIIKMYGQKRFSDVVENTDIPELQVNYHDLFVLYGCMRFYEKDLDDLEGVAYYKNEFYQRVEQLKREHPKRKEPHRVKAGIWT